VKSQKPNVACNFSSTNEVVYDYNCVALDNAENGSESVCETANNGKKIARNVHVINYSKERK